ncbi:hypothetical protein BCR44DRAFT_43601 [Catenaria anguillulae PL171]|uniref:SH3 domain-containing protein n=1 Tax=Catenaria anguillulae PL171 TaxID=765915 RepID=A0A1Y2I4Y6_9FUNG|nr:hypothetical protein BCR44DRAFT_43601 [Catenaria anguillulae PL171]
MKNPLPQSLDAEVRKCSKILRQFVKPGVPGKGLPTDQYIPLDILSRARGIAVLTVVKAGFMWSGKTGSGIVVARLPDGSWSAPSAIATAGVSFGAQIGAEVTDFVIVLNTDSAVKAFSQAGNVTLGGNLSVAAGPWGRTAEASGTVRNLAAVYSYSKSKGLFAGVSIEGAIIIERKDCNEAFYGGKVTAKQILSGQVVAPAAVVGELYSALPSTTEVPAPADAMDDQFNRLTLANAAEPPLHHAHTHQAHTPSLLAPQQPTSASPYAAAGTLRHGVPVPPPPTTTTTSHAPSTSTPSLDSKPVPPPLLTPRPSSINPSLLQSKTSPAGASIMSSDELFSSPQPSTHPPSPPMSATTTLASSATIATVSSSSSSSTSAAANGSVPRPNSYAATNASPVATTHATGASTASSTKPGKIASLAAAFEHSASTTPTPPKPQALSSYTLTASSATVSPPTSAIAPPPVPTSRPTVTAVAQYDFDAQQEGDLGFRRGDVITVLKKGDGTNQWWLGRCNGREGMFPANYVEVSAGSVTLARQ